MQQKLLSTIWAPAQERITCVLRCVRGIPAKRLCSLNKSSMKPAGYGERFVKRRGLFCVAGDEPSSFSFVV
ncbi:hypothetical protein [Bradyrhizobium sp. CCBAU 45321]|uniref:hypothetical protein n=1 Tax=Bradyrhizobium sp. CCBAU 45321 TaxID=1641878 RepID=UPI002302BB2C|nr:hypothetical protein [Bradyrhizobium sp. CCBAU 45321]